jgi:6,7-dimethyl-8-ribityllumazine synthase
MSTLLPPRPRQVIGAKRLYPLVVSQWNAVYAQGLVNHVTDELRNLAPSGIVTLHQVPGSFEIPVVVRELALQKRADAIIAIGVILKGGTSHAEHVAHSVTNALQQIAIAYGVPVINAVLSVENEEQARERCLEKKINRGIEAAHAAIQISNVMAELRAK